MADLSFWQGLGLFFVFIFAVFFAARIVRLAIRDIRRRSDG